MIDLSTIWPLGLSRHNWWRFALAFVAVLAGFVGFDAALSQGATAWPADIRWFFNRVTDLGLSEWILVPSLIVMLVAWIAGSLLQGEGQKRGALRLAAISTFIFVGVGLPGLAANILKRVIGRGRPELFDAVGPFGFQNVFNDYTYQSFPSGHATTSMAAVFVFGFLWPRCFPYIFPIGLLVALSRIPVGMHYPTDVLGGMMLGILGAYAVRNAFAARQWVFRFEGDRVVRLEAGAGLVSRDSRNSAQGRLQDQP